ncbi:GNAT family N-acetyltransferase [Acidaminobacter sp. JC074]|uniref:GNAT family N-acetyltransferase n=1 Tax=Acidaminobacter sp. JC074 TaxID=2530199 RepID=UPI001F10730F|nr:GNAT family N-acetyltransferase [Acidaminobacter sp. JC074]MCH4887109.1 GNAT family N-acetyltransferase [Acidaminobacter sp. JC074]
MNFEMKNNEVDLAIEIMKEVAEWGRNQGYRVWLDEWLVREELITHEASADTFCVGYLDGLPACCMILQWRDETWWPNAIENEAAYIHKLCLKRVFAGKGLSMACLKYAEDECKKRGAKYIRLDTGWDEHKMKELYISMGFEIVEKVFLENGKAMALFEYKVGGKNV